MKRLLYKKICRMRFIFLAFASALLLLLPLVLSSSSQVDSPPEHVSMFRRLVGWQESGYNRGAIADSANTFANVPLGSSYCHSTVLWILSKTRAKTKLKHSAIAQSARSAKSFSALSVIYGKNHVSIGDILTWAKYKAKRNSGFGHSGVASEDWKGTSGKTIQANTSGRSENRDGNGIYEKTARISPNAPFRIIRITPIEY